MLFCWFTSVHAAIASFGTHFCSFPNMTVSASLFFSMHTLTVFSERACVRSVCALALTLPPQVINCIQLLVLTYVHHVP